MYEDKDYENLLFLSYKETSEFSINKKKGKYIIESNVFGQSFLRFRSIGLAFYWLTLFTISLMFSSKPLFGVFALILYLIVNLFISTFGITTSNIVLDYKNKLFSIKSNDFIGKYTRKKIEFGFKKIKEISFKEKRKINRIYIYTQSSRLHLIDLPKSVDYKLFIKSIENTLVKEYESPYYYQTD